MNTKKGAAPLFTGMLVLVLSIAVMITIVAFIVPYFNTLEDSINFKNNKENLLAINNTLLSLKDNYIGTTKEISIYSNNEIEFNKEKKKIIIKQNLNNPETYEKTPKEQIFNNLVITKKNNELVFELDLNNIVEINESFIITAKARQKINFEIIDYDQIPKIGINRVLELTDLVIDSIDFIELQNNLLTIENYHPLDKITITGYQILYESDLMPIDQKTIFKTPIILEPFETKSLEIYCSPKNNFTVKLFSEEGVFNLNVTTNDFDENLCYFGNGFDGNITINSVQNINTDILNINRSQPDGKNIKVFNLTENQAIVESVDGFSVGDKILLINIQGTPKNNVGNFEILNISNIFNNTINFTTNIKKIYGSESNLDLTGQKIFIQRIPQYNNVTITENSSLIANNWDGNIGGIITFMVRNQLLLDTNASIDTSGMGLKGGFASVSGYCKYGYNGEGIDQPYRLIEGTENTGGGGGGKKDNSWCVTVGSSHAPMSGAGGSYGTKGNNGTYNNNSGNIYGDLELKKIFLGSGGGSSTSYRHSSGSGSGGAGGNGGGIILIFGNNIINNGEIQSNGQDGFNGIIHGGGGGGGSGGSIKIYSNYLENSTGSISVSGGIGGIGYVSTNGGKGGDGIIKLINS